MTTSIVIESAGLAGVVEAYRLDRYDNLPASV